MAYRRSSKIGRLALTLEKKLVFKTTYLKSILFLLSRILQLEKGLPYSFKKIDLNEIWKYNLGRINASKNHTHRNRFNVKPPLKVSYNFYKRRNCMGIKISCHK